MGAHIVWGDGARFKSDTSDQFNAQVDKGNGTTDTLRTYYPLWVRIPPCVPFQ